MISIEDRNRLLIAFSKALDGMTEIPCADCEYFRNGWCDQFGSQIPEKYLARGCGQGVLDIPF